MNKVDVEEASHRLVTIEKPATDIDTFEAADVDKTATCAVKNKRRSEGRTKKPVYYTKTICKGFHQKTTQSENELE